MFQYVQNIPKYPPPFVILLPHHELLDFQIGWGIISCRDVRDVAGSGWTSSQKFDDATSIPEHQSPNPGANWITPFGCFS
jgi:hypothetical protein